MMSFRKLFLAFAFAAFAGSATAADQIGIIATVGDDAITTKDLVDRTKLVIISSGMKADEETARKISPQVLQTLINERLQIQDAARNNIDINGEEINGAIASIEQQNRMKPNQLVEILEKARIPLSTLQNQVRAQIAGAKLRSRKISPRVVVTDDEINDYLKSEAFNPQQVEYYLNEIILPVETTKDEPKIRELAENLATDLRAGKTQFKNIAKEFSQAGSAQAGGEVGWLSENQIPKELLAEIKKGEVGKIIGPIRSIEGYFIILINESRNIDSRADLHTVVLRQFELPLKGLKPADANSKINALNDPAKACIDSANYAKSKGVLLEDYGSIQIKELQGKIRKIISTLPVGEFSATVNTEQSLLKFIVCEKSEYLSGGIDDKMRARAKEELTRKKMELESRKYMRELRRSTNIEIKN